MLPLLAAQDDQGAGPAIRVKTRAVTLEVLAETAAGQPVLDLQKTDFVLRDGGKSREIRIFENAPEDVTAPPVRLAPNRFSNRRTESASGATILFLDCIDGSAEDSNRARQEASRALTKLGPGRRIAIYALTRDGLRVVHDFSEDYEGLRRALDAFRPGASTARPVTGSYGEQLRKVNLYALADALLAIGDHVAPWPGRKRLLWVTAGFPSRDLRDYETLWRKVLSALNEADVEVDALDSRGLCADPDACLSEIASMRHIAQQTGGSAFVNRNDLDAAIVQAVEPAAGRYTLGFYLPDAECDGKFHSLQVRTNRPGVILRYRQGYFAGVRHEMEPPRENGELQTVLMNPLDQTGVGIVVEMTGPPGRLRVTLDPRSIALRPEGDGWVGSFDELLAESDDTGRIVGRVWDSKEFRVTRTLRERSDREGFTYIVAIPLKAGAKAIRIAVRDRLTGYIGSLTAPLGSVAGVRK